MTRSRRRFLLLLAAAGGTVLAGSAIAVRYAAKPEAPTKPRIRSSTTPLQRAAFAVGPWETEAEAHGFVDRFVGARRQKSPAVERFANGLEAGVRLETVDLSSFSADERAAILEFIGSLYASTEVACFVRKEPLPGIPLFT